MQAFKETEPIKPVLPAKESAELFNGIAQALFSSELRQEREQHRTPLQAKTTEQRLQTMNDDPVQASSEDPIQCKTGFEMELDVPAYMDPADALKPTLTGEPLLANEKKEVEAFLAGGLQYGYIYGLEQNGFYSLTADHSPFANKHREFTEELRKAGKIEAFFQQSMSKLEYITPPIEETSEDAINIIGESIQDHATRTVTLAKNGTASAIPAPARTLKTGVPKASLKKLIGDNSTLKSKVDTLSNAITGKTYFQQTSGLLPSEIKEFFSMAAADITDQAASEIGVSATKADVKAQNKIAYAKSAMIGASTVVADRFEFPSDAEETDIKQAKGFLTLAAQYYIGSKLEAYKGMVGGTAKNFVAFLSRVDLHQVLGALTADAKLLVKNAWPGQKQVFYEKSDHFSDYIAKAAKFQKRGKYNPEVLGDDPADALNDIIVREVMAIHVRPGVTIDPENIGGGTMEIDGQKMVPLEDRYMNAKMGAQEKVGDQIAAVLAKRWKQIHDLRQDSLSDASKQKNLANKQLGLETMYTMLNAAKYNLATPAYSPIEAKVTAMLPILQDPTTLDEMKVSQMRAMFADIGDLKTDLSSGELPAKKKKVAEYLSAKVIADIRQANTTKITADDSSVNRESAHESFSYTLGSGIDGIVTSKNDFMPNITFDSPHYYVSIKGEQMRIKRSEAGLAGYVIDRTLYPVVSWQGGQQKKLRFDSLGGARVWV